jgi:hypothetical protein
VCICCVSGLILLQEPAKKKKKNTLSIERKKETKTHLVVLDVVLDVVPEPLDLLAADVVVGQQPQQQLELLNVEAVLHNQRQVVVLLRVACGSEWCRSKAQVSAVPAVPHMGRFVSLSRERARRQILKIKLNFGFKTNKKKHKYRQIKRAARAAAQHRRYRWKALFPAVTTAPNLPRRHPFRRRPGAANTPHWYFFFFVVGFDTYSCPFSCPRRCPCRPQNGRSLLQARSAFPRARQPVAVAVAGGSGSWLQWQVAATKGNTNNGDATQRRKTKTAQQSVEQCQQQRHQTASSNSVSSNSVIKQWQCQEQCQKQWQWH